LIDEKAPLIDEKALLIECSALLTESRALSIEGGAFQFKIELFFLKFRRLSTRLPCILYLLCKVQGFAN